jgi:DNA-binding transcriptional regulator YhcF (GntR family)
MINTNSPMFQSDTETLAASQVEMLRAVRDGVQQLSSAEARAKYHLGNPNTISKNKKILQNKDIVELQGGKLVFLDPIYRLWFSKEYE